MDDDLFAFRKDDGAVFIHLDDTWRHIPDPTVWANLFAEPLGPQCVNRFESFTPEMTVGRPLSPAAALLRGSESQAVFFVDSDPKDPAVLVRRQVVSSEDFYRCGFNQSKISPQMDGQLPYPGEGPPLKLKDTPLLHEYKNETLSEPDLIHPDGFRIWAPNGFTVTRNIPARDPWIGNKWVLTGFPECTYPVIITMFTTPKPVDIKTAIDQITPVVTSQATDVSWGDEEASRIGVIPSTSAAALAKYKDTSRELRLRLHVFKAPKSEHGIVVLCACPAADDSLVLVAWSILDSVAPVA